MSDINLQEVHDYLVDVAKQAGHIITAARPSTTAAGEKLNSVDLVTETDQATENLITRLVHEKYPHFECAPPFSLDQVYSFLHFSSQIHGRRNIQTWRPAD
jgi:hypothetical protein